MRENRTQGSVQGTPGNRRSYCDGIKGRSMSDEEYFLQATNEVDEYRQNSALWAKAVALSDGDKEKAKYKYIKLRVGQLKLVDVENTNQSGCASNEEKSTRITKPQNDAYVLSKQDENLSFTWWKVWAWLSLIVGNIYVAVDLFHEMPLFSIVIIGINTILMVMVLNFNKYAFLVATILCLNPLLWIINGFYLKNRWMHPKVNHGHSQVSSSIEQIDETKSVIKNEDKQLFEATRAGDIFRVKALVEAGANPNAIDLSGYSPADYARGHGFSEIEKFLKNA